ncbi:MAG: DUF1549 domain-containing protein [Planctomycetota bacterium]|nr:MAG: DUF1549 domain-containing protein [Planctomycetota bacterium]
MRRTRPFGALLAALAGAAAALAASVPRAREAADGVPRFDRDVRPLLADNCFKCHGPDAAQRKAGLRLDQPEGARRAARFSDGFVVAPGDAEASVLVQRITSEDPAERMPPADSGRTLTPQQIEILRRWVAGGAAYEPHWSFVAPVRPEPPQVQDAGWCRNEIDRFVQARLEADGLAPQPEAPREALLRRVTLDLTGLPPTPEEMDAFLADGAPGAYERVVDRLLASPRHGEHQARFWLDAARYGDTHGMQTDSERSLWKWRDWVIDAYNRNLPYDRFVVEQLAGDLLPDAGLDQKIASGFNRCNPSSDEGGLIPEEFLARYAMDRVDSFGAVFLGLTVGCAQCHDHKFDPITQREYYQLYAYFNSIAEEGSNGGQLAPAPALRAPSPEQEKELERLRAGAAAARARLEQPMPELDAQQGAWEAEQKAALAQRWTALAPVVARAFNGTRLQVQADGSVLAAGETPEKEVYELDLVGALGGVRALRLQVLPDPSLPHGGSGRAPENGNFVLGEARVLMGAQNLAVARAASDFAQDGFAAPGVLDGDPETGWAIGGDRRPHELQLVLAQPLPEAASVVRVRLEQQTRFPRHSIGRLRVAASRDPAFAPALLGPWWQAGPFTARTEPEAWDTAFVDETTPDRAAVDGAGRPVWIEHPEYADGARLDFAGDLAAVYLHRRIECAQERRARLAVGSDDSLKIWLNGALVHANRALRPLTPGQDRIELTLRQGANDLLVKVVNNLGEFALSFALAEEEFGGLPVNVAAALERGDDAALLRDFFRERRAPRWRALRQALAAAEQAAADYEAAIPLTMVSADLPEPRPAFVLARGQYDRPGEPVAPGTPAFLPPLPAGAPPNRLGLARWLVQPGHPLTARVLVNRMWAQHFGGGIVAGARDFGHQGPWPSDPELLDWLADELVRSGWDQKAMHRRMVTSAAYRQRAQGPRARLDAEVLRDQALAVSGLLVERIGGPSVRPYQPPGIWEAVAFTGSNTEVYRRDRGEALYRRSLYTFWKRTAPPPGLTTLDAPGREVCTVERARTNTPLQALALLNDEQLVEAARALAQRLLARAGDADARLSFGFRLCTGRLPSAAELEILRRSVEAQLAAFRADELAALRLIHVGASVAPDELDTAELAAWTMLAGLLLNLDEATTRG